MVKALDRIQSLETVQAVKASSSEAISRLSYQVATALNTPQVQPTAPARSSQPPEVNVHLEIHRLEINNGTDERAFMNKVSNAVLKGIRQYEA
ncbi:MAG: hypothetical protein EOM02_12170 [Synergistales bacterium]|nr:hypothetical protein [Synergistales bacterium]